MRPVSTDSNLMLIVLSLLTVELDEAVSRPWSVWPVSADRSCEQALVSVACIS